MYSTIYLISFGGLILLILAMIQKYKLIVIIIFFIFYLPFVNRSYFNVTKMIKPITEQLAIDLDFSKYYICNNEINATSVIFMNNSKVFAYNESKYTFKVEKCE